MEIKFRKKDLVKTMRRIDKVYAKLVEQLGKGKGSSARGPWGWLRWERQAEPMLGNNSW